MIQEGEDFSAVVAEMLREALVGRIDFGTKDRVEKVSFETPSGHLQAVVADRTGHAAVAQLQCLTENAPDVAWYTVVPTRGSLQQLLTAVEKIPLALLMP